MPRQDSKSFSDRQQFSIDDAVAALEAKGYNPRRSGEGWKARCALGLSSTPSNGRRRSSASASGRTGKDAKKRPQPLPAGDDITRFDYHNPDGGIAFVVVRRDTPNGKSITQWTPAGNDLYLPSGPKGKRPLYGLLGLLATDEDVPVAVFEGEKCVEAARAAWPQSSGYLTTWAGGTKAWRKTDWKPLSGRTVNLIADADTPGRECMRGLAAHLHGLGCTVKIALPEGETGDDIADGIEEDAGVALDSLKNLLEPYDPELEGSAEAEAGAEKPHLQRVFERKSKAALSTVLSDLNIEVRYDVRGKRDQFQRDGGEWDQFNDRTSAELRDHIAENYGYQTSRGVTPLTFSPEKWQESLNAMLASREVDPFIEFLERLPAWDGTERLGHFLKDALEAEGQLAEWAGRFLFLGTVQRAYKPGCKLDEIPVLIGPQGIGKSALLLQMLPPEHRDEWFGDGLDLGGSPKERAEALLGKVIVEAGEMTGATRADIEALKTFTTRQNDGNIRLAYRKNPEAHLRCCIIVGTTNQKECLPNDPTGNRRFVPILCTSGRDQERHMAGIREQCWAEALNLYRDGKRGNLPRSLYAEAAVEADEARRKDTLLEDELERMAERYDHGVTLEAIAKDLALMPREATAATMDTRDMVRLSKALTAQGWEKRRERKDGKQIRLWYPPQLKLGLTGSASAKVARV